MMIWNSAFSYGSHSSLHFHRDQEIINPLRSSKCTILPIFYSIIQKYLSELQKYNTFEFSVGVRGSKFARNYVHIKSLKLKEGWQKMSANKYKKVANVTFLSGKNSVQHLFLKCLCSRDKNTLPIFSQNPSQPIIKSLNKKINIQEDFLRLILLSQMSSDLITRVAEKNSQQFP